MFLSALYNFPLCDTIVFVVYVAVLLQTFNQGIQSGNISIGNNKAIENLLAQNLDKMGKLESMISDSQYGIRPLYTKVSEWSFLSPKT